MDSIFWQYHTGLGYQIKIFGHEIVTRAEMSRVNDHLSQSWIVTSQGFTLSNKGRILEEVVASGRVITHARLKQTSRKMTSGIPIHEAPETVQLQLQEDSNHGKLSAFLGILKR